MRRKLQEITPPEALEAILRAAEVGRLGLSVDDRPYVVPVSYGYENGRVYIHGAADGQKIDMLRRNPRVCFEVEVETAVEKAGETPCNWGARYRSVIAFGAARLLENEAEQRHALDVIVRKYGGEPPVYLASMLARLGVIEVVLEEMTGKRNG